MRLRLRPWPSPRLKREGGNSRRRVERAQRGCIEPFGATCDRLAACETPGGLLLGRESLVSLSPSQHALRCVRWGEMFAISWIAALNNERRWRLYMAGNVRDGQGDWGLILCVPITPKCASFQTTLGFLISRKRCCKFFSGRRRLRLTWYGDWSRRGFFGGCLRAISLERAMAKKRCCSRRNRGRR